MNSPTLEHSNFDLLVLSLGNAALVGLGLVPEPGSSQTSVSLELAQHNIEMLSTLCEKTKGNLTPQESQLLESLLYDLRMKFIEAKKRT